MAGTLCCMFITQTNASNNMTTHPGQALVDCQIDAIIVRVVIHDGPDCLSSLSLSASKGPHIGRIIQCCNALIQIRWSQKAVLVARSSYRCQNSLAVRTYDKAGALRYAYTNIRHPHFGLTYPYFGP